jgi:hypothetical protein
MNRSAWAKLCPLLLRPSLFCLSLFCLSWLVASCVPDATLQRSDLIIDDMEDQTSGISSSNSFGGWYVYDDATAGGQMTPAPSAFFTMEPIPGGRFASRYAMRMRGGGFASWGAGMGFDFGYEDGGGDKVRIDASAYSGVRFWARIGQGAAAQARFSIGAGSCQPGDDGGATDLPSHCAVSYGKNLVLTTNWVLQDIGLSELSGPTGMSLPRDQVYSFLFNVPGGPIFDLWVDDISWIPAPPAP